MFSIHKWDQSDLDLARTDLVRFWNYGWCMVGDVRGGVELGEVDVNHSQSLDSTTPTTLTKPLQYQIYP